MIGAEYPEMSIGQGSDLTFWETHLTRARLEVGVIVDGSTSYNREMSWRLKVKRYSEYSHP